jgi:hypothetical protein
MPVSYMKNKKGQLFEVVRFSIISVLLPGPAANEHIAMKRYLHPNSNKLFDYADIEQQGLMPGHYSEETVHYTN